MLSDKITSGQYGRNSIQNSARHTYAALVAGGVALVGTAAGAGANYLSQEQQASAAQRLAGQGYATPDYGDTIDYLNSNFQIPAFQDYKPVDYTTGYEQFLGSGKYVPRINRLLNKTNQTQNKQWQDQLLKTSPTLMDSIKQLGTNTASNLRGEIPADVLGQVQRGAAEQSLFGGFGNSGVARNLTARDLGLTSLDLQSRGERGLQSVLGLTQGVNPYRSDALQYLMSPSQLLSTEIQQQQFGNTTFNNNRQNAAQIANDRARMIAGLMQSQEDVNATGTNTGNLLNYQIAASTPNPYASLLASAGGALSSYGGGIAAGGGQSPQFGNGYAGGYAPINQNGAAYAGTYQNKPVYDYLPI